MQMTKEGQEAARTGSQSLRAQLWGSEVGPEPSGSSLPPSSSQAPQAPPPPLPQYFRKGVRLFMSISNRVLPVHPVSRL